MRRLTFVFLASVVMLCAVAANAEHTRFWEQSSFEDFDKGTQKGVALRSDGNLMPAPEFKPFADPNLAYIWTLAVDSKGRLYAAGGSDAKVLRLAAGEKPVTVFQSAELEAQAMAIDKQDNLYVATSPDGKVYKVTPEGQHTVFFEPKTKYIWALAFDRAGTLFVATGDTGQVFAVAPDGKGQLFYKSDETHARSLAFDARGDLLIGTDPSGLVIRVPVISQGAAAPKAGKAFVIYETDKKEVTALATDHAGNIYAASIGNKSTTRPSRPTIQNSAAAQQFAAALAAAAAQRGQEQTENPNGAAAGRATTPIIFPQFPSASGGAEVYRIAPDGSPESLWSSPQDVVYTLGFSAKNHLLLGTGNHGDVIELDDDRLFSSLASADASQVTALVAGPNHVVYAATANPGKVFALEPSYAAEGTFESDPFDAKIYSRWGRLSWWGENGGDSKIEFYVRSGNTSDPDDYWSPWSGPYTSGSGSSVNCPPARFVQWKAVFHVSGQQNLPTLSWVKLAYLRKNVAPVLDGIAVQEPGLRAQGFEGNQEGPRPSVVPLHPPKNPQQVQQRFAGFSEAAEHPIHFTGLPQGTHAKGYQTVVWNAHDDNDDDLTFSIYYRGQAEKEWKLLKKDLSENFYSWDTSSMPDGAYYLKIVASDARSNPEGEALTTDMVSDRFEVDNTPPEIENIRASQSAGAWHVTFTAHDSGSAIDRTSYSVNAGKWQMLFPIGQLTDAPSENYDIALSGLAAGEHTVAVRVFDQFENTATAKVTFTVGGSAH